MEKNESPARGTIDVRNCGKLSSIKNFEEVLSSKTTVFCRLSIHFSKKHDPMIIGILEKWNTRSTSNKYETKEPAGY